ncbi:MAG TPA: BadF/BadG/BcrA/BcrD ATPase family protein, partial [Candidatus Krumholzibacteria bacterium]|nr:BadF/BadG/BcrA/BcrD ATPase family protein [Candidatus Krumholzibacteria bacterium]
MKLHVGIDLGSTTTKAVILGENGDILGRGITNSRSNYKVACDVALGEALISARFALLADACASAGVRTDNDLLTRLELLFRKQQFLAQLTALTEVVLSFIPSHERTQAPGQVLDTIFERMRREADAIFLPGASRKSDFFRDLAGSMYMHLAEELARKDEVPFDRLVGLFDKAILDVENRPPGEDNFGTHVRAALAEMPDAPSALSGAVTRTASVPLVVTRSVGTGYGRATLPFAKEQIRSEILCHGLGAHFMFPNTRSVLDIGGQDTKAIQVDERGIVTSFQMNDRCAAGCGRYLGYIADEMNVGLQELGPMACQSSRPVRINSTCTVFAGAELRERLSLGEKREDILAGLHRAIILRAMSILARSGGIRNEFTFTGGVAKNEAAVKALKEL